MAKSILFQRALGAFASGVLFFSTTGNLAHAEVHVVRIEGMKFMPEDVTVKKGDSVEWINADIVPHTITRKAKGKSGWDSGPLSPGHSFQVKIKGKGDLPYVCTLHPTMSGRIHVRR